jgi:hypothetical protein
MRLLQRCGAARRSGGLMVMTVVMAMRAMKQDVEWH